jgi:hypothetical protein
MQRLSWHPSSLGFVAHNKVDSDQIPAIPTAQVVQHVRQKFEAAQKQLDLRRPYEDAVMTEAPADPNLLAAYLAYIKAEEKEGDPARVQARGVWLSTAKQTGSSLFS